MVSPELPVEKTRAARWLFLGLFALYAMTASGGFEVSDAVVRYATAQSWLRGERGVLPAVFAGGSVASDAAGRPVSFYGPLQPALMFPVAAVAERLPLDEGQRDLVAMAILSIAVFPLISALATSVLFRALLELGQPARAALMATLGVAAGSLYWHYARTGQEENLVALGYALWLWGAARLLAGRSRPCVTMAIGVAIALAARWASGPAAGVLVIAALGLGLERRSTLRLSDLGTAVALLAGVASLLLLYDWVRFGDFLETGYALYFRQHGLAFLAPASAPRNLLALLVSPHRGLLWYSPIALVGLLCAVRRRSSLPRGLRWSLVAAFLAALISVAFYSAWDSGPWGPRLLVAPHVLLAPALAELCAGRQVRRWAPLALGILALWQSLSTALPGMTEEYMRMVRNTAAPGSCGEWTWSCSAPRLRPALTIEALSRTVRHQQGRVIAAREPVTSAEALQTSDFRALCWWPVRMAFRLGWPPLGAALGLILVFFALAAGCLRRAVSLAGVSPAGSAGP